MLHSLLLQEYKELPPNFKGSKKKASRSHAEGNAKNKKPAEFSVKAMVVSCERMHILIKVANSTDVVKANALCYYWKVSKTDNTGEVTFNVVHVSYIAIGVLNLEVFKT